MPAGPRWEDRLRSGQVPILVCAGGGEPDHTVKIGLKEGNMME